ncbi:MAG: cellulase family glycosylhydrolase [Butyrivibrio sp.]|nr:cellulase family glycosylhydrolase [Butyrivibrio sp.]
MKSTGKKLLALCIAASLGVAGLSGCGNKAETSDNTANSTEAGGNNNTEADGNNFSVSLPTGPEDSAVYVEAVPDISDDFIRGMDASSVLVEENSGVKFYNFDGKEQDVFRTFAEAGVNYIRIRVWNDPYDEEGNGYGGGNNDLATAVELGKRATQYGMKVCIDFHYSDFWADPKRQHAPKAWENMTLEEKSDALYEYTKESLTKLLDAGVDVGMVQIGNEINYGMAGESSSDNVITLLKSGSKAVREISDTYNRDIQVVVHYTRITEPAKLYGLVEKLQTKELDYDIIGLSFYPFWDGSFDNMQTVVSKIKKDYGKKVIIAETSYCYTSEDGDGFGNSLVGTTDLVDGYPATAQGQASMIRDVIAAANEAGASGTFYWEGAWIPVGGADEDNSSVWEKYGSGWASSYASDYDPEDAGLYYGGSSWDNQAFFDFEGHPLASINVWKYLKYGTTLESAVDYVPTEKPTAGDDGKTDLSDLTNLVLNPGFEDSDTSMWNVKYEGDTNPTDFFEKPEDAYAGDMSFHFFSADSDMDFSIEQEFTELEPGTYYLTAYSQGGDFDANAAFELYAVTSDGELTDAFQLTTYTDWKNPTIPAIEVTDGKLTVGVRIKANAASWGTVDNFELYKISD